jgi:hypothetical protein
VVARLDVGSVRYGGVRMRLVSIRAAGFLAVSLLTACRPSPSPTIVADPALMPLIPADATIIAGFRMTELKQTPVYQRLIEGGEVTMLDQFTRETGIDPRKDIWEIVVASNQKASVAFVRGKFTEGGIAGSGLEPQLEKQSARRFGYKGYTLTGDERVAVTFLNTSVAVAGPTDEVKRIIDGRNGSSKPPADLLDRIRQLPSTNQIYVVSKASFSGPLPDGMSDLFAGLKQIPFDVRGMTATLDLREGVRLAGEIESSGDQNTQRLHDAVRGVIGVGRLMAPSDQPDILQLYDGMKVSKTATSVRLEAVVPLPLFEKLLKTYKDRIRF